MKVADAFTNVARLFLDTAPFIYLVERNPRYFNIVLSIFDGIDNDQIEAITSPITLVESLVIPYRIQSLALRQRYTDQIVGGFNTTFVVIDDAVAQQAADLRGRYNLRLADALQVAVALLSRCDTLLTNDTTFRRVTDLRVVLIDDLEL